MNLSPFFASFVFVAAMISPPSAAQERPSAVQLNWLGGTPASVSSGVSWGVPWAKGTVQKNQVFTLLSAEGKSLPLQSWPLAYWPDGSLKWSGFATTVSAETAGPFSLQPTDQPPTAEDRVKVVETTDAIAIDTGGLQARISRRGAQLVDFISVDGREIARAGQLVCLLQKGPAGEADAQAPVERFVSEVEKVTVEQAGPVRAVIKVEGFHQGSQGARRWLPFTVRLYFYAGQQPVRVLHTVVFDGDPKNDFIRGLGLVFTVPMREEIHNRHVRLSGEGKGLWAEPIEPLLGFNWHVNYPEGGEVYRDQVVGKRIPNRSALDANSQKALDAYAAWDDFRLVQPNSGGFTIEKRTSAQSAWIPAGAGRRSSGLVFAGDVSGGLSVALKNFWQSYPSALEVRHARSDAAELRVWFWSPDAPPMDLRHYDTVAHGLNATYEDVEPDLSTSTPFGVARTSELMLFPASHVPTKEETARQVEVATAPPLLVCSPAYLHQVRAFGLWSLQDRSTPLKHELEDHLDSITGYYLKAVEQWNWYGFGTTATSCTPTIRPAIRGATTWVDLPGITKSRGPTYGSGTVFFAPGARTCFAWPKP